KRSGKAKLKIAGDGTLRDYVKEFIQKNGMESSVEMLGFVDRQTSLRLLQECRAMVLPSQWYENNPISILEAFSTGKPVIGADIGGIPEMIGKDERGLLFKAGDHISCAKAMDILMTQPRLANDMGQKARIYAEDCSEDKYISRIESAYSSIINK
ncbi:glycosyltransferase family 4 protein, partial [Patescibacteria group bacterium]